MKKVFIYVLAVALFDVCTTAYADIGKVTTRKNIHTDDKIPVLPKTHIDGDIRTYYFTRDYSGPATNDQSAFSLGGKLNLLTEPFLSGFRVGGTLYLAQPLGLNSKTYSRVDNTLPGSPITTLGQAYVQYQNTYVLGRLGDQLITTPWVNPADSRMIPSTYQGAYLSVTPTKDMTFSAMRLVRFKSRTSSTFTQSNLYNPVNIGGTPITALGNKIDIGTLAFGVQYMRDTLLVEAWGYRFYNFARLGYGDMSYTWKTDKIINPVLGVQVGNEWNDGSNILQSVGAGTTRGSLYGVLAGAEIAEGKVTVALNKIPKHPGGFQNGDVISPYTTGYTVDPLYTSSMIAGLIEKAAGSAIKVAAEYSLFNKQLHLLASYAKYNTDPYTHSTNETDFDVTYLPDGVFKNLSLRDRIGFLNGDIKEKHFIYNRVMLQYDFS